MSGCKVKMQMTDSASLRPVPLDKFEPETEKLLLAVCPGINISPRVQATDANSASAPMQIDEVWGAYSAMSYAWAADSQVRFKAATGGVLTALGQHLLATQQVAFIYHVKADPNEPLQSIATISETVDEVLNGCGSRYSPVAPLTGLIAALDRGEPFAVIAKPCDLSAIHNYSSYDTRVEKWITHRLAMVCGGQSTGQKAHEVLAKACMEETNVTLYRHRGYGNPGPTRVESNDGRSLEISYQALWEDESSWGIESRCKLCPDALGEAADIAAADVWPGGSPVGEDEGFNGIISRSSIGDKLIQSAVDADALIIGEEISPAQFNDFQPHQVRKKIVLQARLQGLADAGCPTINAPASRLDALGKRLDANATLKERTGTASRFRRESGDGD